MLQQPRMGATLSGDAKGRWQDGAAWGGGKWGNRCSLVRVAGGMVNDPLPTRGRLACRYQSLLGTLRTNLFISMSLVHNTMPGMELVMRECLLLSQSPVDLTLS